MQVFLSGTAKGNHILGNHSRILKTSVKVMKICESDETQVENWEWFGRESICEIIQTTVNPIMSCWRKNSTGVLGT